MASNGRLVAMLLVVLAFVLFIHIMVRRGRSSTSKAGNTALKVSLYFVQVVFLFESQDQSENVKQIFGPFNFDLYSSPVSESFGWTWYESKRPHALWI